jgi:uncharacterized Zn finger protein
MKNEKKADKVYQQGSKVQIYDELGQKSLNKSIIGNLCISKKIEISEEAFDKFRRANPQSPMTVEAMNECLVAGLQYTYNVLKEVYEGNTEPLTVKKQTT